MENWALVNIFLAFATGIIAIVSLCLRKNYDLTPIQKRKVRVLKSVSVEIGFISCLVCIFSEHMKSYPQLVDKWTIVMLLLLGGEILSIYYVDKRCRGMGEINAIGGEK